ncbi:MAG: FmdB family zinc ribbon protein [Gemmatimonadota bacterium]
MPTYEYRCPEGHEFEKFQRMSDPPRAECPECGLEAERILSAGAGLLFKGEGFYITDYRSESYRKAAEKEAGGSGPATESSKPAGEKAKKAKKAKAADGGAPAGSGGTAGKGGEG